MTVRRFPTLALLLVAASAAAQYDVGNATQQTYADGLLLVETSTNLTGNWTCTTSHLICTSSVSGSVEGDVAVGNTVQLCGKRYKVSARANGVNPVKDTITIAPHRDPDSGELRTGASVACSAQVGYKIVHGADGTLRPVRDGDGTETGARLSTDGIGSKGAVTAGVNGVGGTAGSAVVCDGANPGTCSTLTQPELAMLDGITAGTGAAGKAVVPVAPYSLNLPAVFGLQLDSDTAAEVLRLYNGQDPETGETDGEVRQTFYMDSSVGGVVAPHEACSLRARQNSDWLHLTDESDVDAGFELWCSQNGIPRLDVTFNWGGTYSIVAERPVYSYGYVETASFLTAASYVEGQVRVLTEAGAGSITDAEASQTLIRQTAGGTLALPAASNVGQAFTVCSTTAAAYSIGPASAADYIIMSDGTTLAGGNKVSSSGAANECLTMVNDIANYWRITNVQGTFADGGA